MRKQQKGMMVLAIITALIATVLFLPGLIGAGELEPTAAPGLTMHTLDEIVQAVTPLPPGFVLWQDNTRFAVSDEGTAADTSDDVVLDRATELMWARDANLDGTKNWTDAMDYCDSLELGRTGTLATDWRLPSIDELTSLSEPYPSTHTPALPEGHPFVNVQSNYYWSGSTYAGHTSFAWSVYMLDGSVPYYDKSSSLYVWPVRGGN